MYKEPNVGGSEMASREKRPLAPSKTKQKANNDSSSLPAAENTSRSSNKKSKSLHPTPRQQQLAREILEAVATGSQLPAKLEANLPRKRALQTALKRKQKAKKTLIKVKQKVPIKTLKRIADAKKIFNKKKKGVHTIQHNLADSLLVNSTDFEETKTKCKTAKKLKAPGKGNEEAETETQVKSSPKSGKKVECSPKNLKVTKAAAAQKRNESKDRDPKVKRSLSKEPEELKQVKIEPNDNSYELTIEEVIASSMLIGPEVKVEGKESPAEIEIKGRKFVKNPVAKRSLRNGKLRQSAVKIETDTDQKKSLAMSEVSADQVMDSKSMNADSLENADNNKIKVEAGTESVNINNVSDTSEVETNNNGYESAEGDRIEEIGPTLRSKTKARSSDGGDTKSLDGDMKIEESVKIAVKNEIDLMKKERASFSKLELKSTGINNAIKARRSSLNIDMRRTSLYGNTNDKITGEGGAKSQIDEMIDKIKLTIAKTIESKIYKPDGKGLILGKSFEVPKIEEVVAPLSNDATPMKLSEDVEGKPTASKSKELSTGLGPSLTKKEMKTEDAENSVPRVADTAKEIEKLVMGDIEPADSQPSKEKSEQPADDVATLSKSTTVAKDEENTATANVKTDQDDKASLQSTSATTTEDSDKNALIKVDDVKKVSTPCPMRKSTRVAASKSAVELKKSSSAQDIVTQSEKLADGNEKESVNEKPTSAIAKPDEETVMDLVESEISSNKGCEKANENKTVPLEDATLESVINTESPSVEASTETENADVESADLTEKGEETLESLSREVEKLVEDNDNEKVSEKAMIIDDNEASSDIDMQLMIDEEDPEKEKSVLENQLQTNDNNNGCDEKSSNESSVDVQMVEDTVKSTSGVQNDLQMETEEVTTVKSTVTDDKSKETAKAKSTETEEVEEQKENRRVLRTRGDKQKKIEIKPVRVPTPDAQEKPEKSEMKVLKSDDAATSEVPLTNTQDSNDEINTESQPSTEGISESSEITVKIEVEEQPEPQIRTRRSREVKRPTVQAPKSKRGGKKQDMKKVDTQQNKEETLLDNEVAKINENDRSTTYLKSEEGVRRFSAAGNTMQQKLDIPETKNRSKSENDVRSTNLLSDILKPENAILSTSTEIETTEQDCKASIPKDSDEASTSGESSSSVEKILETPEDRAKKEDILRQLGLESWEKVKERKAKKEKQYTGTLKTIIRIQKEKEGKKRSRSPLKMVLKQQGRMDGEEPFDFYTIQKEFGTSGLGDSSSGANRKLPTNPRHSCDEDTEDAPLKDRQSLVIPEKSSSFSIHPGRLCADNCCYCHGKFGSLDTPMHLAQMKSDDRRKKILENEVHLTKDSCLCDACYRHVDRKANMSPTNMQLKPQRQNRQSIMGCMARNCSESARHHVKRRWLLKIKPNLRNQVDINWESTQHNLMTFCGTHYTKIERFLTCTLCKRRLTRNYTYPLGLTATETEELNKRLRLQGIPAAMVSNTFVCRLCRYFTKLHLKNSDFDSMSDNNKDFHKKYRKKLLYYHDIDVPESEEETDSSNQISKNKDKSRPAANASTSNKKSKCNSSGIKLPSSKFTDDNLDMHSTTASEKSSPEPPKTESETNVKDENSSSINVDTRFLGIEGAIEKLKKRKALDTTANSHSLLNSSNEQTNNGSSRDVVEILAMDKEVTLTRLPKRARLGNNTASNDITPVVQRLGANPSISVRTLFPGEEEMNLHANVEFGNVREVTPQGWEKCATMIQYDRDTKLLWQELQRPYGNQSSFLRHLILLEKYYRSGDLILAPNASRNAINYSTSVQNRLISYEGPEKPVEPLSETLSAVEYNNSQRLSGGYVLEQSRPSNSTSSSLVNVAAQLSKLDASPRLMKLTPGVSIIKKPPPNLQRLNAGVSGLNGSAKRKESIPIQKGPSAGGSATGGKVFQLTEPDFKRLQNLKRQKQMMNERHAASSPNSGSGSSNSPPSNYKSTATSSSAYQKAQHLVAQSQFQKHLRMQQEMLNQRSRGDFEPLICDIRSLSNENTPTQNLLNLNLNLPKSIQVTTKNPVTASTPIPILPKIPKSLTVIPQTVARSQDK